MPERLVCRIDWCERTWRLRFPALPGPLVAVLRSALRSVSTLGPPFDFSARPGWGDPGSTRLIGVLYLTNFRRGVAVAASAASIEIATCGNDANKKVSQRARKHANK
jgi:hypothetical protein